MAELTRQQLQAAEDRADAHSLQDDDVVLQTSDTMPEGTGVKGEQLDTAGSDQHGPVYSFTRKQVRDALANWGGRSTGRGRGGRRRAAAGNGRTSRGRRSQARPTGTGDQATPAADTTTPPAADAQPDDAGKAATS